MTTTTSPATKGRPQSFDRERVLDSLIQLFWENGYEATSMTEVVEATGLNKSSLYNSFGPKEALFHEALSRYVELRAGMAAMVVAESAAGLTAIHALFALLWQEPNESTDRRGCLAVNSSIELGLRDERVVSIVQQYRDLARDAFRAALTRAADNDEIGSGLIDTYVSLCVTSMLGMAVLVRSGATNREVRAHIEAAHHLVDSWKLETS